LALSLHVVRELAKKVLIKALLRSITLKDREKFVKRTCAFKLRKRPDAYSLSGEEWFTKKVLDCGAVQ
jgi:hypothetical protein